MTVTVTEKNILCFIVAKTIKELRWKQRSLLITVHLAVSNGSDGSESSIFIVFFIPSFVPELEMKIYIYDKEEEKNFPFVFSFFVILFYFQFYYKIAAALNIS